jgi:sulfite reductase (ferredoxin)
MRRLAAVGITTREAGGNSVRNVTACPYAGVCQDESFDVTPYAKALMRFMLGHPDCQNFGRKFKPAFQWVCAQHACGLTSLHDLGLIAKKRVDQATGRTEVGFEMYGWRRTRKRCPIRQSCLSRLFRPPNYYRWHRRLRESLPAWARRRTAAARELKFLVQDLGIEKFRQLVLAERKVLTQDSRWTEIHRRGAEDRRVRA